MQVLLNYKFKITLYKLDKNKVWIIILQKKENHIKKQVLLWNNSVCI